MVLGRKTKTVRNTSSFWSKLLFEWSLASFFVDNYLGDKKSGLFGLFDGHGGSDVSEYSAKYFKDVIFLPEIPKWNKEEKPIADDKVDFEQRIQDKQQKHADFVHNDIPEDRRPVERHRSQ